MASFLPLAHALADAAADAIGPLFRNFGDLEIKADHSPVTAADRAAERAMRSILVIEQPDHGIIGEEEGSSDPDADWVWVLDPIDGTRAFAAGAPTFTTLIGLMHGGAPVLGIINQPVLNERWAGATGSASTFQGEAVHTRATALDRAVLLTTALDPMTPREQQRWQTLRDAVGSVQFGTDAYGAGLVAMGCGQIFAEAGCKLHDLVALVPVLEGAGAVVTDWSGRPIGPDCDGSILAAHEVLHTQALALLQHQA